MQNYLRVRVILFLSGPILFLNSLGSFAQPAFQYTDFLKKLARDYSGKHRVELTGGITLKPDAVVEEDGFVKMFFKGDARRNDEWEQEIVYPLSEVKKIDDREVDPLVANYQLANFYFYHRRDYIKALRYYRKVLKLSPPDQMAKIVYENLGFCYNHPLLKGFIPGIELNLKALKKFPEDEKLWLNLGTAYLGTGDLRRAEECYQKVLYTKPDSPSAGIAHANLGSIYYQRGKRVEARFHLDEACRIFGKNKMAAHLKFIRPLINKCTMEVKSQ